jgi:hypothetical protein
MAVLQTLYCLQASAAVEASRMIEGDEGERKVVRDMWKIWQPSHADINVTPKEAGRAMASGSVVSAVCSDHQEKISFANLGIIWFVILNWGNLGQY